METLKAFVRTTACLTGLLGVICCCIPQVAAASFVTYSVTGVVEIVDLGSLGPLPASLQSLAIGSPFTLTYTVDTSTTPLLLNATFADYRNAITQASFVAGDYTVQISPADLVVQADDPLSDGAGYVTQYSFSASFNTTELNGIVASPFLDQNVLSASPLGIYTSLAVVPDPMPVTPDNLALQISFDDFVNGIAVGGGNVSADVTSIQPVPLPAAAWLLLSGLGAAFGLSGLRRGSND